MRNLIRSMGYHSLLATTALFSPEGEGGAAKPAPSMELNILDGADETMSTTVGSDNKFGKAGSRTGNASMSFDRDGTVSSGGEGDEPGAEDAEEGDDAAGPEEVKAADTTADEETEADGADLEDLPEFDSEKPEVLEAYEGRFISEDADGKPALNIENLGAEVYANSQKEDGKPVLNEGTYAWLKETLGVSRETADKHIAGEIALKQLQETDFYTRVGGKETFDSQVAWGSANYTPAQKAKFNAGMKAGGDDALEQIELLQSRAGKGGWKLEAKKGDGEVKEGEKPSPTPKLGIKRALSPKKTASTAETPRGSGSLKGYANNNEYVAALKEAGADTAKQAEVRKNLVASKFWKANQRG